MRDLFREYWNASLADISRQLTAAKLACEDERLTTAPSGVNFATIAQGLRPVSAKVNVVLENTDRREPGQLISKLDHFPAALEWLQFELNDQVNLLPAGASTTELRTIQSVLKLSADEMPHHFGTLTEGWDKLVGLKQSLLLPDKAFLARSAWLVAVIADFERSIRDSIALSVQFLGHLEPIRSAVSQTYKAFPVIALNPDNALNWGETRQAVADSLSHYMAGSVKRTLQVAKEFARALEIEDKLTDCYTKGFHIELASLGRNNDEIISTLIDLRNRALHDRSSIRPQRSPNSATSADDVNPISRWDRPFFATIAQFLFSCSLRYNLSVMNVIRERLGTDHRTEELAQISDVARVKAAGELRVYNLQLLRGQLWWLAWSVADYVAGVYEEDRLPMLPLNAGFAQKKLSINGWQDQVEAIDVSQLAPRYRILRKSILEEWEGIEQLMEEALQIQDMGPDEFRTWPALEKLREREVLAKVLQKFT